MGKYRVESEREIIKNTGVEFFYHNRSGSKASGIPHLHSAVEILFIKKGKFKIFANDILYDVEEGSVVLLRSNTAHIIINESKYDAGYYVLKFSPQFVSELSAPWQDSRFLLALAVNSGRGKTVWDKTESSELFETLKKLVKESKGKDIGSDMGMRLATGEMILKIVRFLDKTEQRGGVDMGNDTVRRIYETTRYIDNHYAEPLRADECAARACMSYSYFSRCFSKIMGKSFKEYLNSVRVNHAERAIYATDAPITDIALDNGFNDVSYFICVYKALKGITPHAARMNRTKI